MILSNNKLGSEQSLEIKDRPKEVAGASNPAQGVGGSGTMTASSSAAAAAASNINGSSGNGGSGHDDDDIDRGSSRSGSGRRINEGSSPLSSFIFGLNYRDNHAMSTDEASSMLSSNGPYQVIEYDPYDSEIMAEIMEDAPLTIEDNTPAAEAIRANANVRVSTFGKAARAVHMQSLRRFVKRATGATKSGVVRGKPPRIPEVSSDHMLQSLRSGGGAAGLDTVLEAGEESIEVSPKASFDAAVAAAAVAASPSDDTAPSLPSTKPPQQLQQEEEGEEEEGQQKGEQQPQQPQPQHPLKRVVPAVDDDGHIPDTIVAGTVEASRKGKIRGF